jgi:hypothetical protein
MQYRWISLSLASALVLGSSIALAADQATPAAKPATSQAASPQPKPAAAAKNRPYPRRPYLVTTGVYSQDDYYKIKDYFVAVQPPATTKAKK